MKKYLKPKFLVGAAVLLGLLMFFSCDRAEAQEFNYEVSKDNLMTNIRLRENTWHTEFGMNVSPRLQVVYRYADLDGLVENRVKFTYDLLSFDGISLKPRMEYRMFDDDNKDDHWRFRMIAQYDRSVMDNVNLWVKLQPRWELDNADLEIDDWRNQFGLAFDMGNMSLAPFFELHPMTGKDTETLFGTYFKIKL